MPKYKGLINTIINVKDDVSDITIPWRYSNYLETDEPEETEQQLQELAISKRDEAEKQLEEIRKKPRKANSYEGGVKEVKSRHNFWVNSVGSKQEHQQRWKLSAAEESMKPKKRKNNKNDVNLPSDCTYSVSSFEQDVQPAIQSFTNASQAVKPQRQSERKRSINDLYDIIEKGDIDKRFQEQVKRSKSNRQL